MGSTVPPQRWTRRCAFIVDLKDAITYIVHRHTGRERAKPLTRTRLVKLLYLADLAAAQTLGNQITPVTWKSYYYGPFSADVLAAADGLDGDTIMQSHGVLPNGDRYFCYTPTRRAIEVGALDARERHILDVVVDENATKPLQEILDYVYEQTPYKNVGRLGETIQLRPH